MLAQPFGVGLLAGGIFGIADIIVHTSQSFPRDIFYAVAMAAPPAAVALLVVCIPLAGAAWLSSGRPERASWFALVSAVSSVGLISAVLLLTNVGIPGRWKFVTLSASMIAAVTLSLVLKRTRSLGLPGVGLIWTLTTLMTLIIGSSVMLYLEVLGWPRIIAMVPFAIGSSFVGFAFFRGRAGWSTVAALALVGVVLFGVGDPPIPGPERITPTDGRPNIVIIVLDTTRVDHLGAYGDDRNLTPRLDELAADAVIYETAYSTTHWTVPSHASLFTGLHPVTHGATRLDRLRLEDRFDTLAELVKAEGYATAALYSNIWLEQSNLLQGFDTTVYLDRNYIGLWLLPLASALGAPAHWIDKGGARSERELAEWLSEDRPVDAPFFLFVNLLEAHSPYVAPRGHREDFLPEGVGFLRAGDFAREFQPADWHLTAAEDPEAEAIIPAMYAAEVRYQDTVLGRIFDLLGEATDSDRNLIFITGDHGENLHDAYRWGHEFEINENLVRVPLIVRYPESGVAPQRVEGLSQLTDILPTVFDALGRPLPVAEATGRSLNPAAFRPWNEIALHGAPEFASLGAIYGRKQLTEPQLWRFMAHKRALRTGPYKYVWSSDGHDALYVVDDDPLELDNRIENLPDIALELRARLMAWWEAQPVFVPTEEPDDEGPMSEDLLRQLRSLGYIR